MVVKFVIEIDGKEEIWYQDGNKLLIGFDIYQRDFPDGRFYLGREICDLEECWIGTCKKQFVIKRTSPVLVI